MTAYQELAKLLIEDSDLKPVITHIPTFSRHEHLCREVLNRILDEDSGSYPLIISLCAFPVQIWAERQRKGLRIDLSSLQHYLDEEQENYCGIVRYSSLSLQKGSLTDSEQMLKLTEMILNGESQCSLNQKALKTLGAIHCPGHEDVSKYYIDVNYGSSVREVIDTYGRTFQEIDERMGNTVSSLDHDMKTAFHNTEYLIQIAPLMKKNAGRVRGNQIDFALVYQAIQACIRTLLTYPFEGKALHEVIILRAEGYSEAECARIIGKSRKYIHARYEEGIQALSSLLWGYSAREIMND